MDSLLSVDEIKVWYRTPAGLVLADGTEHDDHDRFNADTSNTVDDCTAVLHRVVLIFVREDRAAAFGDRQTGVTERSRAKY